MLPCPTCLVSHVLLYLTCLVLYLLSCCPCLVPHVLSYRALRTSLPTCSRGSRASCFACSCASRASCPVCTLAPRASFLTCLVPYAPSLAFLRYVPLVPHTLSTLCANITFYALKFQCPTLLFFCSFPTCDFLGEFIQ